MKTTPTSQAWQALTAHVLRCVRLTARGNYVGGAELEIDDSDDA